MMILATVIKKAASSEDVKSLEVGASSVLFPHYQNGILSCFYLNVGDLLLIDQLCENKSLKFK